MGHTGASKRKRRITTSRSVSSGLGNQRLNKMPALVESKPAKPIAAKKVVPAKKVVLPTAAVKNTAPSTKGDSKPVESAKQKSKNV